MEDFRNLFYEEARELISKLEETLLLLEDDINNKEHVNEVFRIMHSLKGSGAMFGFNNLSSFTHDLESLYDQIRSDNLKLNSDIISITISAADHITELLDNDVTADVMQKTEVQKALINDLIQNKAIDPSRIPKQTLVKKEETVTTDTEAKTSVYYIRFEPNKDILNDGTNPLYLVDELVDLGDTIISIDSSKLPDLKELNPMNCYLSWTVVLSSTADISEIQDVFIFVEDESNLVIELLSEKDLFSLANSKGAFEYLINNKPLEVESFRNIASEFEDELKQTDISVVEEITNLEEEESNEDIVASSDISKIKSPDSSDIETVKVSSKKLDQLINLVSELVTTQARLVTLSNNSRSIELAGLSEDFQHLSRQFRDIAFDMRLIPIQTMMVKFKRLVRDLSNSLGKKVKFTTEGTETELDKSIIASLSDPVMHIIRNAIDHGIESPETRVNNNKPEMGLIHLKAKYSGTSFLISIEDDGAGIDHDKILKKAIHKNIIKSTDKLSTSEIYDLLLLPGFSTSETVSDISGRGVGMDVVRKKIDEIRGEISISSEPGRGTKVLIKLPLTLSIIDGLLIRINNERFVIPLSSVKKIYKIDKKKIQESYNNIIDIDDVQFPFINLTDEFASNGASTDSLHFITIAYHDKTVGIIINELISEYQAVLKPIGKILKNNEIFAGASILGDGKVALVLDINKVIDFYST